ncbi:hypothetical protein BV25DRAFT_1901997 [Artomyces pyxidatus]|uniref:Uncharacterized protein n=1 Tax=Artomyces pyxidatus TaxID=48021 RepID=A0ACB8SSM1_9AGAM|nr:hypothetical protein BV25DRAFT_1901997 [Artomyces pyxidatus]
MVPRCVMWTRVGERATCIVSLSATAIPSSNGWRPQVSRMPGYLHKTPARRKTYALPYVPSPLSRSASTDVAMEPTPPKRLPQSTAPSSHSFPRFPDTGDRPYKCQHCGDQFARSDLLSRHVNKCHPNEKPLVTSAPSRRKGSASASRATTSKQACDQCVQSSLPCDGANPCAKCVHRKTRCTYVKFHRQTAPMGPGHPTRPNGDPTASIPSLSNLPSVPASYRLSDAFLLGNGPSTLNPSSIGSSQLYSNHPFNFPNNSQLYGTGTVDPTLARDSFENAAEYSARYRAQAELLSRTGVIPGQAAAAAQSGRGPPIYSDGQQLNNTRYTQQYPLEDFRMPRDVDYGYNVDNKPVQSYSRDDTEAYQEQMANYASGNPFHHVPQFTIDHHQGHERRPSTSDGGSTTSQSQPSSAASSSVHLPLPNDYQHSHLSQSYSPIDSQHQRPHSSSSAQEHGYPSEGEGGFSSAFGLMSLDDPAVLAGLQGTPFFDHVMANGGWGGDGVTPRAGPNGEKEMHMPASTPSGGKELKEMWKQYMRTPLSGLPLGQTTSELLTENGAPRSPRKERGLSRVASLPSVKTPSASASSWDPMRSANGAAAANGNSRMHNNPEDLRSYEQAVIARKVPLTLNLQPKRRRVPTAGGGSSGSDDKSLSASPQHLPPVLGRGSVSTAAHLNLSRPSSSSSTSSLAHAFGDGRQSASPGPLPQDSIMQYADDPSRPSFKRLPSQTLGPEFSKRPMVSMLSAARDESAVDSDGDGAAADGKTMPPPAGMAMKTGLNALGGHHQQRLVDRSRRMSAPTMRDSHGTGFHE